jgi:isocitrate/isopropylmalate dehydrogenase
VVAKDYPGVEYDEIIVDICAMQLVMRSHQYDVLVLTNLYGNIISDLAAGLIGGLGVVPGANIGDEYAVFESVHGSAPDIAGKGIANPLATIGSAIMMLRHLGEENIATKIRAAITLLLAEKQQLTPDLGGKSSTHEITDALIEKIKSLK